MGNVKSEIMKLSAGDTVVLRTRRKELRGRVLRTSDLGVKLEIDGVETYIATRRIVEVVEQTPVTMDERQGQMRKLVAGCQPHVRVAGTTVWVRITQREAIYLAGAIGKERGFRVKYEGVGRDATAWIEVYDLGAEEAKK